MGISFSEMTSCGSMVSDLFSVAWVAIPLGLLVAVARHRPRPASLRTLDLGR